MSAVNAVSERSIPGNSSPEEHYDAIFALVKNLFYCEHSSLISKAVCCTNYLTLVKTENYLTAPID